MENIKSIILSAGKGERLLPLTNSIPKGLVKIFGKSFLQNQIEILQKSGISDISIVTGYLGEKIKFDNVSYYKNEDYENTNMVESLFCAEEKFDNSIIVSYGDIIFEKQVLEKLINSEEDFSIIIDKNWEKYWNARFDNLLADAESLSLDDSDYIQNIGQNVEHISEIQGQYIGLMKFQGPGLKLLRKLYHKFKTNAQSGINPLNPKVSFKKSYMTDFLQGLINQGCKL